MSTSKLPKAITKKELFEEAQVRFQSWVEMYTDPKISVQYMYEDMSCSCYSGSPEDDFPDDVAAERQDNTIRYQYKDGACYFIVDGIEVDILDLRDMRKASNLGIERYIDICVPSIMYKEEEGSLLYHIIPDAWLYGSTTSDFNKGEEVHQEFIDAARDYIKAYHITKDMQKEDL